MENIKTIGFSEMSLSEQQGTNGGIVVTTAVLILAKAVLKKAGWKLTAKGLAMAIGVDVGVAAGIINILR